MSDSAASEALVVGAFSRRMRLRVADGGEVNAKIRGRKLKPVCGDRVEAHAVPNDDDWLVVRVLPRRNELTRPDSRGRVEVLAANLDAVFAVAAPSPAPDWFVVDRYLAAAAAMGVTGIVVLNKSDRDDAVAAFESARNEYRSAGYDVIECSARSATNIESLAAALRDRTAIIVGQSGVGKSSLINALVRDAELRTASVSGSTGEGKHTTVNSVMIELPGGGAVIDSPGVRDYAPALDDAADVATGFPEILASSADCRFANCRHLREPDCGVKSALSSGRISPRRYESYKRLMALAARLADRYD